ncbi:histone deacetylase [Malassezia vespertilionis]|uniref:Histone deacetylase domain-containing protein n=1 Tax=Malassezia vespertilionis TaxID=2020962 RepID=A0A2N1JCX9_9BASI|nr:histone deacetylase [Malassezia vespertilionis]PKI84420.1 hypothetical protein MVES_001704 [Malassezia vespertilionis]WFD06458.1 histone deacetylase [Malassezia vespertilionis]
MVFIVKLPPRNAAEKTPSGVESAQDAVSNPHTPEQKSVPRASHTPKQHTRTAPTTPSTAHVDVLLAPSVLQHKYVRGVDKSSIVERPERIRAALLGIAGAFGMGMDETTHDPSTLDDLADILSGMRVQEGGAQERMRVFTTQCSLDLDAPSEALRLVHAHADEPATYSLATAYNGEEMHVPHTHTSRVAALAARAPSVPPGTVQRRHCVSNAFSDMSSDDGEGDKRMHPSEVPAELPQGDLYLCGPHAEGMDGGSRTAIAHALGASTEAVDRVVAAACSSVTTSTQIRPAQATLLPTLQQPDAVAHIPAKRAFVLSRPPGHHCSGNEPQGFCWVNNAAVAAAHGYIEHGIDRVVVLDIDLHHGNGTQTLAWRMNADAALHDADRNARLAALGNASRTSRGSARTAARAAEMQGAWVREQAEEQLVGKRGLRVFYGSVHDIESFPCENGDVEMIRNASVCLDGAHDQWIWNVHLDKHDDDAEFDAAYTTKYAPLFDHARRFVRDTLAFPSRTLVVISCGFDACTHEYPGMQRHGKHVPPAFYARFARDAANLADEVAQGKLVSLLEGGYSDRALASGALAHIGGLAHEPWAYATNTWSLEHLALLERMAKRVLAAAAAAATASVSMRRPASFPRWVVRASEYFAAFQRACHITANPLEVHDVVSAPRSTTKGVLRGLADLSVTDTPSKSASGHALRDRTILRTRSQLNLAYADATPVRARRGPRPAQYRVASIPSSPETPKISDPSVLLPGALVVESVPSTPRKELVVKESSAN